MFGFFFSLGRFIKLLSVGSLLFVAVRLPTYLQVCWRWGFGIEACEKYLPDSCSLEELTLRLMWYYNSRVKRVVQALETAQCAVVPGKRTCCSISLARNIQCRYCASRSEREQGCWSCTGFSAAKHFEAASLAKYLLHRVMSWPWLLLWH